MTMTNTSSNIFIFLLAFLCLASSTWAFGAGEIPKLSNQAGRAFRHGDIESVIEGLAKGAVAGGGAMGFIKGIVNKDGPKFNARDVKRLYFGNWLRDFSQVVDVGGLSKLTADSLVLIVSVLGFVTFGFATEEFEVTRERLGVYLTVEHIDNPKGYPNDAQQYDERLRPPVDEDAELAIDPSNGMKAYIASTGQGFDTSADCVTRYLEMCIYYGRKGLQEDSQEDKYEAYRLLGCISHIIEDFPAHSNFVELCLHKMGYTDVYPYVGDCVKVEAPNGDQVPPIITGTFGGSDLIHSLMSEVGDKMVSCTISDLDAKLDNAHEANENENLFEKVHGILSKMPSGGSNNDEQVDNLAQIKENAYNLNPEEMMPADSLQAFKQAIATHDNVMRNVENLLAKVPMVQELLDEMSESITLLVMSVVEPYIKPFISQVTEGLSSGTDALLQSEDQTAVFKDDYDSNPTHSVLSKDHFANLVNFVAGKCAQPTVENTVKAVVNAWEDEDIDIRSVADKILEALHHPYWANGSSEVQESMFQEVKDWFEGLDDQDQMIASLSKESVRNGQNKVEGDDSYGQLGHGDVGHGHVPDGFAASTEPQGEGYGYQPSYDQPSYDQPSYGQSYDQPSYDQPSYQQSHDQPSYDQPSYDQPSSGFGGGFMGGGSGGGGEYGQQNSSFNFGETGTAPEYRSPAYDQPGQQDFGMSGLSMQDQGYGGVYGGGDGGYGGGQPEYERESGSAASGSSSSENSGSDAGSDHGSGGSGGHASSYYNEGGSGSYGEGYGQQGGYGSYGGGYAGYGGGY